MKVHFLNNGWLNNNNKKISTGIKFLGKYLLSKITFKVEVEKNFHLDLPFPVSLFNRSIIAFQALRFDIELRNNTRLTWGYAGFYKI